MHILTGTLPGHFFLIVTSVNFNLQLAMRICAVALESDDHRYYKCPRSVRNYLISRSCLASKQIVLSLSRLCIMQSMVLSLGSISIFHA